ncbi:hypothetical protein [Sporosarcina sp. E16_8]|uniref:hypothetical protein n=1 Tax=Sporosarcina sp. E16_8 TaxID=2789295 RepID=UPI001A911248|nr:hypothetical protein [Sporosarcina sp. E16_8]MBO0588113.1 hypothetical protein [Sporosarcina sp. E16_8]
MKVSLILKILKNKQSESAIERLCTKTLSRIGVGVDALGIERGQEGLPKHEMMFATDIIIIEGICVKRIGRGKYFMVAASLKLTSTDGSSPRVLLVEGQI